MLLTQIFRRFPSMLWRAAQASLADLRGLLWLPSVQAESRMRDGQRDDNEHARAGRSRG